ncbi:MAG: hypothetical protein FWG05_05565 [Kiritimatiellaeota bacterium]|nr:hypothetical protein [Kiritimatiellota bacterium]
MKSVIFHVAATTAATLALISTPGCDSADGYNVEITPSWVAVRRVDDKIIDRSVRLTAHGWGDYTWSLDKPELGYLSSTHGESVVYTVLSIPEPPSTQYDGASGTWRVPDFTTEQRITVKTRDMNAAATGTNSSSKVGNGQVRISHQWSTKHYSRTAPDEADVIRVNPASATLSTTAPYSTSVVLNAIGDDWENYTWSIATPGIGHFENASATTVTYVADVFTPRVTQTITLSVNKMGVAGKRIYKEVNIPITQQP